MKTNPGRFFEDYTVGETIIHAVPRTVSGGERALYHGLYPARHALFSSDVFAQSCGLPQSPVDDLVAFHVVFGKTVPDISLNAVANLGYAEGRWLAPVYCGDTIASTSEVIGVKENSNGKTGVVYVRTSGVNQDGVKVLEYVRWAMVRKRDAASPAPNPHVPELAKTVAPEDLVVPKGLTFENYDTDLAGEKHRWDNYEIGEVIDHVDGVTVEEAEHMIATRLWQNTAKVHFDGGLREDGKRLIYGGHVISMARALSFNGLANAQKMAALNAGTHVNPCFAGDTIYAWSEVLDKCATQDTSIGALRLRLVAMKGHNPGVLRSDAGKYASQVLLDFDYWCFIPV